MGVGRLEVGVDASDLLLGNIRARAAVGRLGCLFARHATDPTQGVAQQVLNLRVHAAEVVVGPTLYRIEQRRVDAQEKRFPVGHVLY